MKKFRSKYQYSITLLKELVKTDFKLRYKGSILGMAWSALKPFLLFLIMYIVFVRFLRFGDGIPHFAMCLLLSTVLMNFFTESTIQGMHSIVDRGDVLRKINIPKYIIPVSASAGALINLAINMLIVVIFSLLNGVQFTWTALLIIPILLELCLLSIGTSLLLSALFVKYRDISHIWEVLIQGLNYATPTFWPISMMLSRSLILGKILLLSPLAQMVQDARWATITKVSETVWSTMDNMIFCFVPLAFVLIIFIVGATYFKSQSKYFTEIM